MAGQAVRRCGALSIVLSGLLAGHAAAAAEARRFDIPRKALAPALVDLATTAGVSISTRAASRCAPQGQATVGTFTLEGALGHLLAGTGCTWRLLSGNAVEIIVAPPPKPSPPPAGQTAPVAVPTADLDELIIVATRRPTRADRLPYAVSSRDGATLAAQGIRDDGDLTATVPAMIVTNLGPGRNKILLRGLSDGPLTGRTQSMVGIYLDEVRLTYNAPDPDLKLVDMAQVEVLRGPQGSLYGAGSLGGVVHMTSVAPDRGALGGWLAATVATTKGGAASNDIEGALNAPFLDGRGAARIVAYRDESGGYIRDSRMDLKNVNRSIRQGLRISTAIDLDERWTLSGGVVSQSINSDDTQYAIAGQPAYSRDIFVQEPHDNDFAEGHLGLQGRLPWADLKWTTAVVSHHLTSRYDATSAPPVPVAPGPTAVDDNNGIRAIVSEAVLTSRPDAAFQWLAGLFVADSRQNVDLRVIGAGASPTVAYNELRRDELDEAAIFGEAVAPLGSRFEVTLGGRLFSTQVYTQSIAQQGPTGPQARFSSRLAHAGFAPKVMLSYSPGRTWLAYLQASEGYRSGGFNTTGAPSQLFGAAAGETNRVFAGDELWNFEAGIRLTAFDDRLTVRAAAFESNWKAIQSDELLATGFPFTANIGNGRNTGLEFEGAYRRDALVLRAEFLLNEPELRRANPAYPTRTELGLAGVPGGSGGLSAHYAWDLPQARAFGARAFELDGRIAYVGRSHLTFDSATSPAMGGYATGRLAATLRTSKWSLVASVDNPADVRGNTFAYGNPFTLRTTRQVTPLRPRTASISLRVAY